MISAYDLGAEMLNFGALFGFMGVNVSALIRYFIRGRDRRLRQPARARPGLRGLPLSVGQSGLDHRSRSAFVWLALGVLYGAWRTSVVPQAHGVRAYRKR